MGVMSTGGAGGRAEGNNNLGCNAMPDVSNHHQRRSKRITLMEASNRSSSASSPIGRLPRTFFPRLASMSISDMLASTTRLTRRRSCYRPEACDRGLGPKRGGRWTALQTDPRPTVRPATWRQACGVQAAPLAQSARPKPVRASERRCCCSRASAVWTASGWRPPRPTSWGSSRAIECASAC
jgi:hypothetical protein